MNYPAIAKCLVLTGLVAVVLALAIEAMEEIPWWISFVLLWPGLFFTWWYLSRRLGRDFTRSPKPKRRRTEWGRMFLTALLSSALSYVVAVIIHPDLFAGCFIFFWIALYYASPLLTKRLPYLGFSKSSSTIAISIPKRPLWRRALSGTGVASGVVAGIILFACMTVIVPLSLCHLRAKRVHDSIHVGMTVPQVLSVSRDCDIFQAGSEFPYDKEDLDHIPAMSLGRTQDGVYHTYDPPSRQNLNLSESEAVERLHARLHDGYPWHFHYTYTNVTPQHVTFVVDFGTDGRVSQVGPVYGWD